MIEWFYGKEGQQYGPIDEVTLSARIATGEIGPQDLVWNEGMDSWKPLQEVRQLISIPSGKDSQTQDLETQDPETQDPETQDPETQDPETQDPETQDPETQDPETQDLETQPPELLQSPYAPPVAGPEGASYTPGPSLPVTNGLAIASMICGIFSVVLFCLCGGIFLGIPAVICGHLSLNQLNVPGNVQQGRGMAIAGLICGYLGIAFFIIMVLSGNVSSSKEI